jgi:ABC-type nitrate/sulfonate/bicarbonate transport system substrate-binding protein
MNLSKQAAYLFICILLIFAAGCGSTSNTTPGIASGASGAASSVKPAESPPADKPLVEMTIATVGASGQSAPIYYAMENGMFTKSGIKLNMVTLDPAASVAALISGDAQIVHAGPNVVDAAIKTDRVRVIGTYGELPYMLYAKNISKLEELKGKTVGSTTAGGANDYVARTMVRTLGLKLGTDVKILYVGGSGPIIASLNEGNIDAGLLTPPTTYQAEQLGLKQVAFLNAIDGVRGKFGVMGVHQPYAQKNPQVIENYLKVYSEASQLLRTNKAAANAITGKYAMITDEKVLDASYEAYKDLWPTDFHIPETEVQFLLDELSVTNPQAKTTKPSDVVDNRYADAVKK